jgi:murein L,D-transpeptidase YcbB/YkuD
MSFHPLAKSARIVLLASATARCVVQGGVGFSAPAWAGDGKRGSFLSLSLPFGQTASFQQGVKDVLVAGMVDEVALHNVAAVRDFYAGRDYKPFWFDTRSGEYDRAAQALNIIKESWTHGLNPGRYHAEHLVAPLSGDENKARVRFDVLMTDAAIRYGVEIVGFHHQPQDIGQKAKYWRAPRSAEEIIATLQKAGPQGAVDALVSFAPKDQLYARLRQELIAHVSSPARINDTIRPVRIDGGLLRPGEYSASVHKIRILMGVDYDPAYGPERFYDDRLAAAVMAFQNGHGLGADGVIGPKTLKVMNMTVDDKIRQLIANMERLRWLEDERPDQYILVNVPSATLWAVRDNQVQLEMPVVVGRPKRETRSFITEISGVRFNPKWTVPPTIKAKDFLPNLIEDPQYLVNKGIRVTAVIDGQRQEIDSTAVDWASLTPADLSALRMIQDAGDDNALGRVRVLMDNDYDIYLHDTNAPGYFKKSDRALSSGCIRMADPEGVADFILQANNNWSRDRMTRIIASDRTSEVMAQTPVPVFILYQTIWIDAAGALVFGEDIYGEDSRLLGAMKRRNFLHIPSPDALKVAGIAADSPLP